MTKPNTVSIFETIPIHLHSTNVRFSFTQIRIFVLTSDVELVSAEWNQIYKIHSNVEKRSLTISNSASVWQTIENRIKNSSF